MKIDSTVSAVVTGGASGLGAATARALAAKGAKVAIFDLQEDKGEAIAQEIGGIFCAVDVTSDESVDAGFAKAREALGQECLLVLLCWHRQRCEDCKSLERRRENQAFSARSVQWAHPDQSHRYVSMRRQIGSGNAYTSTR